MSVEIDELKKILDIKLKNNEPKLIDKILNFLLIECDEEKCDEKELEQSSCVECGDNFCDEHIGQCYECGEEFCEGCGVFQNCSDCDRYYCDECSNLYLRCGDADCEKFSCCSRFICITITRHSDFGTFGTDAHVIRCENCISYLYDNM